MVYQEVGCNEPCLERKSIKKEANSTDKKKMSGEDSVESWKLRRNEGEKEGKDIEKVDDRPAPVIESNNSEDDSDELPDIKL